MAAATKLANYSLAIALLVFASTCEGAGPNDHVVPGSAYSDEAFTCSQSIHQLLTSSLDNAPNFESLHEAVGWTKQHLPKQVKNNFAKASHSLSTSLRDWKLHGMIQGPFWNNQALSELFFLQSSHFDGIAGCGLRDDLGVTREILQDQLYIVLLLKDKLVKESMEKLGISDPLYAKRALFFGVMLDFAGIDWTDQQLSKVALFQLPLP